MLYLSKDLLCSVQYKFYATLLDAFAWYLSDEREEAFQEFINKLNRVPFTSEAAAKGTAFNELVDKIKNGQLIPTDKLGTAIIPHAGKMPVPVIVSDKGEIEYPAQGFVFKFKWSTVERFVNMFEGAQDQVYVEAVLPTAKGNVMLYGYIDEVPQGGRMSDIKCTGSYEFPKFLHNWQHVVYPYCMLQHGIEMPLFSYDITDYNNFYKEEYVFAGVKDTQRLAFFCERLIDFIESQRHLITDKKLFAQDVPKELHAA